MQGKLGNKLISVTWMRSNVRPKVEYELTREEWYRLLTVARGFI